MSEGSRVRIYSKGRILNVVTDRVSEEEFHRVMVNLFRMDLVRMVLSLGPENMPLDYASVSCHEAVISFVKTGYIY